MSTPVPSVPEAADLRHATLSGVRWTSAARGVAECAAFASSIALARLIPPSEFGFTVIGMFVASLAQSVSTQGVGSFLVQLKAPAAEHFRAAMLLCLLAGAAGTLLTAAFALGVAPSVFGDRAADLLLLAAPVALISAPSAVPMAQLQRQLDFRTLAAIDVSAALSVSVVSLALAIAGLEGEAIILGMLASMAVTSALAWFRSQPARSGWFRAEAREIVRFGAPATLSSILYSAVRNVDYVILAAWLPAAQVGYYLRAFTLGSEYQAKISGILLRVAFPVLSRTRNLAEMRRIRSRMIRVHASLLFPLLLGLVALAPTFVPFVYGAQWTPAAELTQILAIGGMISAVGTGTGPLLLATGHPRALLVYNLIAFCAYAVAVLVAVPHGVLTVCWAVVMVRLVTFVALQYAVVERRVGIPLLETVRDDVFPATAAGLALLAVMLLAVRALDDTLPSALVLALPAVAGMAVYCIVMRACFRDVWDDMLLLFGRLAPRSLRFSRHKPPV